MTKIIKPNTCPFCKETFSDEDVLENVKLYKKDGDIKVYGETEFTFYVDIQCPNQKCGFSDNRIIESSNTEIDHEAGQKYALYFWKEILNANPDEDRCPSCGYKVDYDESEFVYPAHLKDKHMEERTYNIACSSHNYDCCIRYTFKSKLKGKDVYDQAKVIWNKIYE